MAAVVAVVALLLGSLWVFQRRMIYFPSGAPVPPASSILADARDVRLETTDGLSLGAWFVPAVEPDRRIAVLVANGNAGDRAGRAPLARALSERGLSVLLFDYRGYAGNEGSPSEDGLALDVRAARRHLVETAGIPPERVIYFGESLGTGVVVELATEHPPGGLVLRSPYVDLAAVGRAPSRAGQLPRPCAAHCTWSRSTAPITTTPCCSTAARWLTRSSTSRIG
jgi:alpha-beta hydrolase superfamily lysophospholipase